MTIKLEDAKKAITFDMEIGIDGAVVIHIDTGEDTLPCNVDGPAPLRVYINDGDAIYANPPYHYWTPL